MHRKLSTKLVTVVVVFYMCTKLIRLQHCKTVCVFVHTIHAPSSRRGHG